MSTLINDTIGLVLIGVSFLLVFVLKRANNGSASAFWVRNDLPTLLGATLAVGFFSVGLGVVLDASL